MLFLLLLDLLDFGLPAADDADDNLSLLRCCCCRRDDDDDDEEEDVDGVILLSLVLTVTAIPISSICISWVGKYCRLLVLVVHIRLVHGHI